MNTQKPAADTKYVRKAKYAGSWYSEDPAELAA